MSPPFGWRRRRTVTHGLHTAVVMLARTSLLGIIVNERQLSCAAYLQWNMRETLQFHLGVDHSPMERCFIAAPADGFFSDRLLSVVPHNVTRGTRSVFFRA